MMNNETMKEVLIRAKDVISDPTRWTRGVSARNIDGEEVSPADDCACGWCATGVVEKAAAPDYFLASTVILYLENVLTEMNLF